jgi:hypothetical protein
MKKIPILLLIINLIYLVSFEKLRMSELIKLFKHDDIEEFEKMYNGKDINKIMFPDLNYRPIHFAARFSSIKILNAILNSNVTIDQRTFTNGNCLHYALIGRLDIKVFKNLLEKCINCINVEKINNRDKILRDLDHIIIINNNALTNYVAIVFIIEKFLDRPKNLSIPI